MHSSTSLIAIVATMLAATVTGQAPTSVSDISIDFASFSIGHTYAPPDKSSLLSDLAAKVSSQVTESFFKADVSQISEAKTAHLVSDITAAAAQALWSGTKTSALPAWLTALPTTGYAYAAINGDIADVFRSELENATPVDGSLTSSLTGKASSLESSLSSKVSSLSSSIGSKISSAISSASSTGGAHEAQATGGLMAMGAVVGGVAAVAALL